MITTVVDISVFKKAHAHEICPDPRRTQKLLNNRRRKHHSVENLLVARTKESKGSQINEEISMGCEGYLLDSVLNCENWSEGV